METYKYGMIGAIDSQERYIMEYVSKLYHLTNLYQMLCYQKQCMILKDNIQVVKYPMDIHPGNKRKFTLESNLHQGNIYKTLEDLDKLEKITRGHLVFGK